MAPGSAGEGAVLARFGHGVHEAGRAPGPGGAGQHRVRRYVREAGPGSAHPPTDPGGDRQAGGQPRCGCCGRGRRNVQPPRVVVIELPLLDRRRQREYSFDAVVVVDAPEDVAVQRSVKRGMSEQDARARLAAQPAAAERLALADRVLMNNGDLEQLEREVDDLWAWLVARGSSTRVKT